VIKCAWTDDPPPYKLVRAWMMEKFHCLPHQLDEAVAKDMFEVFQLLALYNEWKVKRK